MKSSRAAMLALLFIACARAAPDAPAGAGGGCDAHAEAAMEEYEAVERLLENPIDPKRATLDMLIAVPDFPVELAERVIEARSVSPSGAGWFELLSPPEREALRRFERFVELPGRTPIRVRGRLLRDRIGAGESERTDAYLAAGNERWVLRVRSRSAAGRRAVSPYVSRMTAGSSVNLCFGDFRADFATGLLFDGSFSFYPFSAGFPLRGYRWIVPAPALSTEALRGAAVETWKRRARGVLFAGRRRTYRDGTIRVGEPLIWAGRGVVTLGTGEVGMTCCGADDDTEPVRLAVDGRWRRGRVRAGFELGTAGEGAAGSWCVSAAGKRGEADLFLYRAPAGFKSPFGSVPGGELSGASWRRGIVAVVRCTVRRRTVLRSSYERFTGGDATERDERDIVRSECEARWQRSSLTVSHLWNRRVRGRSIPYPGGKPTAPSESDRLAILFIRTWGCAGRLRLSARLASEVDGSGWLTSSSVRFGLFRCRIRCTSALTLHRPLRGTPVLYAYEPVLEGCFPWSTVRGRGWRCTVLAESFIRGVTVAFRFTGGSSRDAEAGIMLSYNR